MKKASIRPFGYKGKLFPRLRDAETFRDEVEGSLVILGQKWKVYWKPKKNLGPNQFQCQKCKKVHNKSAYCVAQQAMHHALTFTCDCGHKFPVPE